MLTRKNVSLMLALYFGVLWLSVVLRIDRFPLTVLRLLSGYGGYIPGRFE